MADILIIDDEEYIRDVLSTRVLRLNHQPATASTLKQGLEEIQNKAFDLVFLDVNLPDGNGLDLLQSIRENPSKPEVIIITAVGNPEGAELAIKNGAWDYLTKPLTKEDIILRIKRAIEYRDIKRLNAQPVLLETEAIIGKSPAISKCFAQVAQCAAGTSNVLILGETGTGKELFANAIHDNCRVIDDNFVVVDCAAMPESLAESVLFGHVKGAFTGADRASEGLVLKADKGTLFLDEIGELPLSLQSTFLRVLHDRRFRPVGSCIEKSSDFRLISATNRNLDQMVSDGTFRNDLLHRIRTFVIEVPPLRERIADIQEIATYHIKKLCAKHALKNKVLLPETLEILESYKWPGNVRELVHTLERAILFEPESSLIYPMFLPDHIRINFLKQDMSDRHFTKNKISERIVENQLFDPAVFSSLVAPGHTPTLQDFRNSVLEKIEPAYLNHLLAETGWDIDKTARLSGLSKNRVYVLIKKYNLKHV